MFLPSFLLCLLFTVLDPAAGYDVKFFPAPEQDKDPQIYYMNMFLHTERQANIKAVLTKVSKPVGFVHPQPSSPDPDYNCTIHKQLATIAESYGCAFAVNGGVFDMDKGGDCIGSLIGEGVVYHITDSYASFGITKDGRYAFGTNINSTVVEEEGIVELISGFSGPLLVEDGVAIHSDSTLIAQRTAVGIDAQGTLLFLTIDGAETPPRGMNISELGDAFVELGAVQAVNLDGGGSTSAWKSDIGYIDRPTCIDTPVPSCARHVADIVCVMPGYI